MGVQSKYQLKTTDHQLPWETNLLPFSFWMSKQVQVTFHQGVHSCDLRFTRDYVGKSLLICLLILDLSSSSSDLQLMCEGLRDKSLSSVKVLKDVYTYCDLSKQFTDPSLKRWNFCD